MSKFDEPFLTPMRCGGCNSTALRVEDECIICNDCGLVNADDVKPVAVIEDPMDPWTCPWCGKGPEDLNVKPDNQRSLMEWDAWLENHVTRCEPYLAEINLNNEK